MASTYTPLGVELQATGENAGTWGTKTNTNLQIIEQISGGFTQQSIAGGAQTTTLSVSDGSTGAVLSHRMIEFTGSITGNQIVTIPLDVQTFYILRNSTSGAYTVQFKYVSGSGDSFTFSATNKGDKVVFASANDGTNPDIISVNTGITDVVSDTSPQLGADLDTNSFNIAFDDAHGINDENGNEQIIFQTTSSAVNQFDITNAATGNPPQLSATGGDSNIDLNLLAKGTGHVTIVGNSNSGAIQFNCESNSHGQIVKAQPHSAGVTNEMLLPAGSSSTLVSLVSTDTLENKTLTTPVIAEIDSGSSITLDATTDIVLDAGGADITLKDDGTTFGSLTNSSGELVIKSGSTPTTAMTFSGANVTFAGTVTIGSAGISEAELEILDGATVTTDELNILDGVTSTASELNIMDGDTSAVSTTLADADRLVTNDAGTMKQVALTDVKTYLTSAGFSTDDPTALAIALG